MITTKLNKCLLCNEESIRANLCKNHFFLAKQSAIVARKKDSNPKSIKAHHHNLCYCLIKSKNINHIKDMAVDIMGLALLYFYILKDASLIEKTTQFLTRYIKIKETGLEEIQNYKQKFYDKDESDFDFREKWRKDYRCEDGHNVRSVSELVIDNYLYHHGIVHSYEKTCIIKGRNGKEIQLIPDFYLIEYKAYLEFWGKNDKHYVARKLAKEEIYNDNNIKVIGISTEDLKKLDDVLSSILNKIEKNN